MHRLSKTTTVKLDQNELLSSLEPPSPMDSHSVSVSKRKKGRSMSKSKTEKTIEVVKDSRKVAKELVGLRGWIEKSLKKEKLGMFLTAVFM